MYFLGIDVGTGGTRALVIDEVGRVVASATEEHHAFASPRIGWAEQDPSDWWRACGVAIPKALALGNLGGDQITCVGLSGQMHGAVLLEEQARVVRPALIWCDVRTEKQSRDLTTQIGAERLIQLTCNPALTNFTLTKCLWVRENETQHWKKVRSVMLPKDYVRLQLTGERATDMADASGTLLLDVAHRCWSKEMLEAVQMDESLLPNLYESPDVCGQVSAAGAASTGLRSGTPVVAGAGDQAAGSVGIGVVSPGAVSATIGTSGVVLAATDSPALDPGGRLHTFCHALPGRWLVMGVTQAAGLSLRWFRDQFGKSTEDQFESYENLTAEAAKIRLGGGGARSALWRQIQADAYGHRVEIVEAEEGAAYGAAILAGVGAKAWPSVEAACDAVVRVAGSTRPNSEDSLVMEKAYAVYRRLYPAMKSILN